MLAILMTKGTRYACHVSENRDQVCLPSFLIGTRYTCHIFKIENKFSVNTVISGRILLDHKVRLLIAHHFRQSDSTGSERALQEIFENIWHFENMAAYLVLMEKDGRHTWYQTKLKWQACLVPFVIKMANMPDPHHDQNGKHS